MLTNDEGVLTGLFTDSDLARLFEDRRDRDIDQPIGNVMTRSPTTITQDALLSEAVQVLAQRRISELPVVTADGRPRGLIDITDVVGMLPAEFVATDAANSETNPSVMNESPDILPLTRRS